MEQVEIVRRFYDIYYRSPRKDEFIECGGNLKEIEKKFTRYHWWLEDIGFPVSSKGETIEVLDDSGKAIYIGTATDIAEEFEVSRQMIPLCLRRKCKLKRRYSLKEKRFDINLFERCLRGELEDEQ